MKTSSKDIFDNLKTGQSVAVVVLNSVSFYSPQSMAQIIENDDAYNKTPLLFLVFSYIKNETFNEMLKTLSITNFAQKGIGQWLSSQNLTKQV